MTRDDARALDRSDPLAAFRDRFALPEGVIYLDGNSLGVLPRSVTPALADTVTRQWGERLIRSWNEGWIEAPQRLGAKIAPLIGAAADEVIVGDTTSTHLFKALVAALRHDPARRTIVSEAGNFPTDLHIAEGAIGCVPGASLKVVARDQLAAALGDDTAVLLLTHVHYKTAERFDLADWTARAHAAGALMLWDLSHSVGAVPVDLAAAGADLAVGCTYKYLNGGPGAPAFIHVAPAHADVAQPILAGWFGHDAPFAFERGYRPASGVARMRVGTPPIVALSILDAALDAWDKVDIADLRAASIRLSERFIREVEAHCPHLTLASPRDPHARGSQVSFTHPHAYAVMQALIARGVIGDVRAPDVLRFGFTPLYLTEDEVAQAAAILAEILATGEWDQPHFHQRANVT